MESSHAYVTRVQQSEECQSSRLFSNLCHSHHNRTAIIIMKAPTLVLSIGFLANQFSQCDAFTSCRISAVDWLSELGAATSLPLGEASFQPVEAKEKDPNVGVLLLNLGGPEKTDDVEGMEIFGSDNSVD